MDLASEWELEGIIAAPHGGLTEFSDSGPLDFYCSWSTLDLSRPFLAVAP
jgi:hypothetical protein